MNMSFEIDRAAGAIITIRKGFFSRKKGTFPARDVRAVRLLRKAVPVVEGYEALCYAIVLEGRGESLELLSTEDERVAASCYRELSEFLEHYGKQAGSAPGNAELSTHEEEQ